MTENEKNLVAVHRAYRGALLSFLHGFSMGSRATAEDLLQETMIRVWRRIDDLPADPDGRRRWLYTVARHVGIDSIRRSRARPVGVHGLDEVMTLGEDDPTESVVAMDALVGAVRELSTGHRQVLAEIYLEGRSIRETADRLGLPVGTVKSRAFYALRSLRSAFEDPEEPRRPTAA
jgi:RNA polymerase sigma-70 factor (ECF subfamily)